MILVAQFLCKTKKMLTKLSREVLLKPYRGKAHKTTQGYFTEYQIRPAQLPERDQFAVLL